MFSTPVVYANVEASDEYLVSLKSTDKLYFGCFLKSFLIFLVLRTPISPVNLCPWSLSVKYESAQWHSEMDLSLTNYSRSKLEQICCN